MKDNTLLQEELSNKLEQIELYFSHWMGRVSLLGLVLLPLVPGSLALSSIGTKFPEQLGIPVWLAWSIGAATALGIELLGLIAVRLALKMRRFNKRAAAYAVEHAPLGQGYGAAVLYVATVLTLTMLLKIWPHAAVYALLPMSLLGALADWIYALSSDQNEREQSLRRLMTEAKTVDAQADLVAALTAQLSTMVDKATFDTVNAERAQLTAELDRLTALFDKLSSGLTVPKAVDKPIDSGRDNDSDTVSGDKPRTDRMTKEQRQMAVLMRLRDIVNPDDIDHAGMAETFGASERTIRRDIEDLVSGNRLVINGTVKVL